MLSRWILRGAAFAGGLAMLAMTAITLIWITVPQRIVYTESSPVQTDTYRVEVKEHGQSYFLTPEQKQTVDWVRSATPVIWFGGFGTAFVAILVGAAAWLRMKDPSLPS